MNKIFPDFILAESAEDLNSNKNINNSIIARPNSIINENNLIEKNDSIFSGNKNIYLYSKIKRKNNDSNILKKVQKIFYFFLQHNYLYKSSDDPFL